MVESSEFKKTIASILKIPVEKVKDDCALVDLISDSFALVDMVVELQEEYGARLTQEHLKDVRTVNELWMKFNSQTSKPD